MIYKDIFWKFYHGALIPMLAPHIKIELTRQEERELLSRSKAYFIRYISKWDSSESNQFWYVIKDTFSGMEELSSNTKSKVRRGLKHCIVKRVNKEEIAEKGYDVYGAAFKKYNTYLVPMTRKVFKESILSSSVCDFWIVIKKDEDKMIAYSQNRIEDNSINYETIKFHPEYLNLYPSYALFYTMNQYYLEEENCLYVNDGARSISHETNIQDFLIDKFKFRKAYCKLHIVYRWDIELFVNLLYPFRNFIKKIDLKFIKKISILLYQEEIRRSYE